MKIGVIGVGKIASAVIEGLCTSGMEGLTIRISPRNEEKSRLLANRFAQVFRMESNQEVLDNSDLIILALRPPHAPDAMGNLVFRADQTVISLIPLIKLDQLSQFVSPATRISRAVPLPTAVNHNCPIPIFRPTPEAVEIFNRIGQPFPVDNENQLHALWTLTCLITPYYDLLQELSAWTISKGVEPDMANRYTADLFESLSHAATVAEQVDFNALSHHAATPNGLNEQSGREIRSSGAHQAFVEAAERILGRFPK